jgi:hypothetical protein
MIALSRLNSFIQYFYEILCNFKHKHLTQEIFGMNNKNIMLFLIPPSSFRRQIFFGLAKVWLEKDGLTSLSYREEISSFQGKIVNTTWRSVCWR